MLAACPPTCQFISVWFICDRHLSSCFCPGEGFLFLLLVFSDYTNHLYSSEILAVKRNAGKGVVPVPASIHPSEITSVPPQVAVSVSFWFTAPTSTHLTQRSHTIFALCLKSRSCNLGLFTIRHQQDKRERVYKDGLVEPFIDKLNLVL